MKSRAVVVTRFVVGIMLVSAAILQAQKPEASKMMQLPDSQAMLASAHGFTETVDLLVGAIEEQNMMVVKEIDAQKMLRMANKKVGGMKQLLFFHPRYMKRIIETNALGTIEPPLKIAIMERPDGKVMVKYIKPSSLLGKYAGLSDLGDELDNILAEIASVVKE